MWTMIFHQFSVGKPIIKIDKSYAIKMSGIYHERDAVLLDRTLRKADAVTELRQNNMNAVASGMQIRRNRVHFPRLGYMKQRCWMQ